MRVFNDVINDEAGPMSHEMSFYQMNSNSVYNIKMVPSVFGGIVVNTRWQRAFFIVLLAPHLCDRRTRVFSLTCSLAFFGTRMNNNSYPTSPRSIVQTFLGTENVQMLFWHAQLPDLSPIEKVWSMVSELLARQHTPSTFADEWWHRVEAAWASESVHVIKYLLH
ncbi:hypothetical protein TNCV_785971 [Trichonephila clavipes]|nr:hypothetical protein TNCV_785971 [Trichonephila clavipes]